MAVGVGPEVIGPDVGPLVGPEVGPTVGPLVGPEVGPEVGPKVGYSQQFGTDVVLSAAKVLCRRPFRLVIVAEANNN
jgi:hypothetical protein